MSDQRELSPRDAEIVAAAGRKAEILYDGTQVPHHSCGIAIAATFGLPTRPYQALRRGGITGCGTCGAVRAGEQVLGEILGDPDPTGSVTDELRQAAVWYQAAVDERVERGASPDLVCNNLTAPLGDFRGSARHQFCTGMATQVALITAEALVRHAPAQVALDIAPIPGLSSSPADTEQDA